jgi:acyl-ACP thioesterase
MVMKQIKQHISDYDKMIFGTMNKYCAKAVRLIRAKEFLAELLGTFILVVSS